MSLLGNHSNEFERKLKKQLGDTEFKPGESLWDRIDKEVNRPEFERKVEGRIGRFETSPRPETWEYIEANLPPEPHHSIITSRRAWYSLFILLFIGGAFLGYRISLNDESRQLTVALPNQSLPTGMAETGNAPVSAPARSSSGRAGMPAASHEPASVSSSPKPDRKTGKTGAGTRVTQQQPVALPRQSPAVTPAGREARVRDRQETTVAAHAGSLAGNKHPVQPYKTLQTTAPAASPAHSAAGFEQPVRVENNAGPDHPPVLLAAREPAEEIPSSAQDPVTDTSHIPARETSASPATDPGTQTTEIPGKQTITNPEDSARTPVSDTGKQLAALPDSAAKPAMDPGSLINTVAPVRLSISVLFGMHQGHMHLTAPAGMESNRQLRSKLELPAWDWSGGFLLDYKINRNILVSSGFILSGFSMNMNYDLVPSGRSARLEQGATYQHENDSIVGGSVVNNGIKYTWTELPLFVTFRFNTERRLGFEVRTGISYAMLGTVDAAMIGQDNIGVLILKTRESFPVLRNSFFAHLYAGISFRLNETVTLSAMPYVKYSVNSMVKNEKWIQQHPWMAGCSLGLRKSF